MIKTFQKFITPPFFPSPAYFSSTKWRIEDKNVKNPLSLNDGEFGLTSEIKMAKHLKWIKGDIDRKSIGFLGQNFGALDPMYLQIVKDKFGINLEDHKDSLTNDYKLKLDYLIDYKKNLIILGDIINTFNPLLSYSLAFLVYNHVDFSFKTIGKHYLVNNSSNPARLLDDVYRNVDHVTLRYSFSACDTLMIKFWPLHIKVKDQNFALSNLNPTLVHSITKTNTIPPLKNKFLSSSFIPLTMHFQIFYGELLSKQGNVFHFLHNNRLIKVEVIDFLEEHIVSVFYNGHLEGAVRDVCSKNGFIRAVLDKDFDMDSDKKTLLYIEDFKLINLEYKVSTKFLSTALKEYTHKDKLITIDIESYLENDRHIPYACGFYDGNKTKLYYSTSFKDWREMIKAMVMDIISKKYAGYRVYAHNFNKFDSAFLFRVIQDNFKVSNLIPRDTGLLAFTVTGVKGDEKKRFTLRFVDSIALLPFSLASLGDSFKVEVCKDVFPYEFVNATNLDYEGVMPDYKYYPQSLDMLLKYENMVNWYGNKWGMKEETFKYLTKDLVSLHLILSKMDEIVYSNYRINITNKPTIASLAMAVLRSNFMDKYTKLPKTRGAIELAVRSAYYGGRNEVFRPVEYGVYSYDFNSLYPTALLEDLPVGEPIYSLIKDLDKIFGFIKVSVRSPDNINVPVLPVRLHTKGGTKLVFPRGTWIGWYFSEEVKLAVKYGYEVEVLESYLFERGKGVLANYVHHMAAYKENSTGAIRNIHKLLLNTPYGRMGMKNIRDVVKIVSEKQYAEILKTFDIIDAFKLSNDQMFVKHRQFPSKMACAQSGVNYEEEIMKAVDSDFVENSTPIAAATTAWARIKMYPWILDSAYTDTDSIFLSKKLSPDMLGKGLGKFKAEYGGKIHKAIFVSPKLYYLSTLHGEISKAKGISANLNKFDYVELLKGGSLSIKDKRWIRNLSDESVTVKNQPMLISGEYDKRVKLYSMGRWVNTTPLLINSSFEIVSTDIEVYQSKSLIKVSIGLQPVKAMVLYRTSLKDVVVYQPNLY